MDKAHFQNASGATDRVLSRRCTGVSPRPPAPEAHCLDAGFNDPNQRPRRRQGRSTGRAGKHVWQKPTQHPKRPM